VNPPTQPQPLPSHRAPRTRLARDLIGLLLVGVGTVGLLGVLYAASPPVALLLIGLAVTAAGGTILYLEQSAPPPIRITGYVSLTIGLALVTAVAYSLTPWSLLFGLLLAVAAWLSGEGA
jgi:hypothetical protein